MYFAPCPALAATRCLAAASWAGILHDDARRRAMEQAMTALGVRDAAERIYETVQAVMNGGK